MDEKYDQILYCSPHSREARAAGIFDFGWLVAEILWFLWKYVNLVVSSTSGHLKLYWWFQTVEICLFNIFVTWFHSYTMRKQLCEASWWFRRVVYKYLYNNAPCHFSRSVWLFHKSWPWGVIYRLLLCNRYSITFIFTSRSGSKLTNARFLRFIYLCLFQVVGASFTSHIDPLCTDPVGQDTGMENWGMY